jgi:hypothetical protein
LHAPAVHDHQKERRSEEGQRKVKKGLRKVEVGRKRETWRGKDLGGLKRD